MNTQVQDRRQAETQIATATINQAARQNICGQAALSEWSELIASAPKGHSLKLAAKPENWIEEQQSLQAVYSQIADRLDEINYQRSGSKCGRN